MLLKRRMTIISDEVKFYVIRMREKFRMRCESGFAPGRKQNNVPETLIYPENTPAEAVDACETPHGPRPPPWSP